MSMRERILERMRDRGGRGVSFVELSEIEGFDGDWMMSLPGQPNKVLWASMSEPAIDALSALLKEMVVVPYGTTALVYLIDGCGLRLPIGKRMRGPDYAKPHWLPITFSLFDRLDLKEAAKWCRIYKEARAKRELEQTHG